VPPGANSKEELNETISIEALHLHTATSNVAKYRFSLASAFRVTYVRKVWDAYNSDPAPFVDSLTFGIERFKVELRHDV